MFFPLLSGDLFPLSSASRGGEKHYHTAQLNIPCAAREAPAPALRVRFRFTGQDRAQLFQKRRAGQRHALIPPSRVLFR